MPSKVKLYDKDGNLKTLDELLVLDKMAGVLVTLGVDLYGINNGTSFTAEHNAAGGSGTQATISFTTPSQKKMIHLLIAMRSNVEAFYTLGEAATMAVAGSDYAPRNRNRWSKNTSEVVSAGSTGGKGYVTLGGTVSAFGTTLETLHFGTSKAGGEITELRNWVLAPKTTYAVEVESEAALSEITIEIHYHEHLTGM